MKPIDIAALVDQYIQRPGAHDYENGVTYPDLFSLAASGREWLTDKYWLLPRDLCDLYGGEFDVKPLPDASVKNCAEWIAAVLTNPLTPSDARFSATFAGVLTEAGLAARKIDGYKSLNALVYIANGAEERVGAIMPIRAVSPETEMARYLPLPVSAECLELHRRLSAARVVNDTHCWQLAAHMTNAAAES